MRPALTLSTHEQAETEFMGKFEKKWEELKTDSQLDFPFLQEALAKYQVCTVAHVHCAWALGFLSAAVRARMFESGIDLSASMCMRVHDSGMFYYYYWSRIGGAMVSRVVVDPFARGRPCCTRCYLAAAPVRPRAIPSLLQRFRVGLAWPHRIRRRPTRS